MVACRTHCFRLLLFALRHCVQPPAAALRQAADCGHCIDHVEAGVHHRGLPLLQALRLSHPRNFLKEWLRCFAVYGVSTPAELIILPIATSIFLHIAPLRALAPFLAAW